jgi:hypothetical protein
MMDACGVESYTKQRWMLVGLKAYFSERDKGTTNSFLLGLEKNISRAQVSSVLGDTSGGHEWGTGTNRLFFSKILITLQIQLRSIFEHKYGNLIKFHNRKVLEEKNTKMDFFLKPFHETVLRTGFMNLVLYIVDK